MGYVRQLCLDGRWANWGKEMNKMVIQICHKRSLHELCHDVYLHVALGKINGGYVVDVSSRKKDLEGDFKSDVICAIKTNEFIVMDGSQLSKVQAGRVIISRDLL